MMARIGHTIRGRRAIKSAATGNASNSDMTPETAREVLDKGPAKHLKTLQRRLASAIEQGVSHQAERMERSLKVARRMQSRAND